MEWIYQYSLFLVETVTIVAAIIVVLTFILLQRRRHSSGELEVVNLTHHYREIKETMQSEVNNKILLKKLKKQQKKKDKLEKKARKKQAKHQEEDEQSLRKPSMFVISFIGSMDAHEVNSLRREITAILSVAQSGDEVLLNLESPGGVVHGYGLAASQLQRLKEKQIRLTVAVDKVAASGGYMMACVADHIVAAPFAILGSIGVVAQIPNVHRLLKKHDIDIELHTAGQYKRTLTLLGENTDEGRTKFKEELDETHQLFKAFVHHNRPTLDIDSVATGEHWFGSQAKEKGLVDEISTSDDVILSRLDQFEVIGVRFVKHKKALEKLTDASVMGVDKLVDRWIQKGQRPLM